MGKAIDTLTTIPCARDEMSCLPERFVGRDFFGGETRVRDDEVRVHRDSPG